VSRAVPARILHAGCVIGDAPQDLKYLGEPTRLRIGEGLGEISNGFLRGLHRFCGDGGDGLDRLVDGFGNGLLGNGHDHSP
jgi:hypothetical protein